MPILSCLQEGFYFFGCLLTEIPRKPCTYYSWRPVSMPSALPIFWQSAIKRMAHNNHYVVWGVVPAVLACAAGDSSILSIV